MPFERNVNGIKNDSEGFFVLMQIGTAKVEINHHTA